MCPGIHRNWGYGLFVLLLLTGCPGTGKDSGEEEGDADEGGSSGLSCEWRYGSCAGYNAPEGSYECSDSSEVMYQCLGGIWEQAVSCSGVYSSDGYSCTCKGGGCQMDYAECSYAFDVCGSIKYDQP